jgi:transposase
MKIKNIQIESQNLDHLGLVSGMCDEIGLVDAIDNACGQQAKNKHLTYGECVKCMILNGLGFVGRTLYLYSQYFEDKPTDLLIGPSVKYQHIDDNALGCTLDRLFQLGVTELYTKIALAVVKHLEIQVSSLHLDSSIGEGYFVKEQSSSYSGINQRWIVIFSEAAYQRECKTLNKNFQKGSEKEIKAFYKLSAEVFSCPHEAEKHLRKFIKESKYTDISKIEIVEVKKHPTTGRPKKGVIPSTVGYQIAGEIVPSSEKKQRIPSH